MAAVIALVTSAGPAVATNRHTADQPSANPYFTAPFTAKPNSFTFGQDPSWTADGRVLSNGSGS